jgi:hypothetical protein
VYGIIARTAPDGSSHDRGADSKRGRREEAVVEVESAEGGREEFEEGRLINRIET